MTLEFLLFLFSLPVSLSAAFIFLFFLSYLVVLKDWKLELHLCPIVYIFFSLKSNQLCKLPSFVLVLFVIEIPVGRLQEWSTSANYGETDSGKHGEKGTIKSFMWLLSDTSWTPSIQGTAGFLHVDCCEDFSVCITLKRSFETTSFILISINLTCITFCH